MEARASLRSRVEASRVKQKREFLRALPGVIGNIIMGVAAGVVIIAMLAVAQ